MLNIFDLLSSIPLIACVLIFAICVCMLFLSRHIGRSICYISVIFLSIVLNFIFKPKIWLYIIQVILTILILCGYVFLQLKITYDFSNKIFSITFIVNYISSLFENKKDSRIIGRVLPYNNYQLKYNGKLITMSEIASAGATLISGSVGSGKTYGMLSLMKQNILDGKSVIFAEYKGDPKVIKELTDFAEKYNYKIFKLESGNADFNYDPLQNLNNVGRIEAIINMRKWDISGSDAHYKTGTQLLLQKLIGDFSHIYDRNNGSYTKEFYKYLKTYHPDRNEFDSYSTVSKLMELLITSSLSSMFDGEYDKTLNFKELKNDRFLVVISFVSSNKELATSFSSLLLRDLLDECTVESPINNIFLYMDETGTLENPFIVKDILEKGRSGKIATTLGLQDINQIIIQTNEAYLNSILGIINNFIIYSGCSRQTAEKFAGVQLHDIERVIMDLRKPIVRNGKCVQTPTAIYISKYPTLNKRTNSEVFRFSPFIVKEKNYNSSNIVDNVKNKIEKAEVIRDDIDDNLNLNILGVNINENKNVDIKINNDNNNDNFESNEINIVENDENLKEIEVEEYIDYNDFI